MKKAIYPKKKKIHKVLKVFGIRQVIPYELRVSWFLHHYYETGMEYEILLDQLKKYDLNNLNWYDETIKIPEFYDEI